VVKATIAHGRSGVQAQTEAVESAAIRAKPNLCLTANIRDNLVAQEKRRHSALIGFD
jgi:hypothetical protein